MNICGTHKFSILQISQAISELGHSHLIYRAHGEFFPVLKRKVGNGDTSILVADGIKSIRNKKFVVVTAPIAELAMTNIPILKGDDLPTEIEEMFKNEPTKLEIKNPEIMDFVNTAVTPSILTDIQTRLYQISNPMLRKSAQVAIIKFLDTRLSLTSTCKILRANYKTEDLAELVSRPEALALREAVIRYRKGEDLLKVELETNFTSFDILYVCRSAEKEASKC